MLVRFSARKGRAVRQARSYEGGTHSSCLIAGVVLMRSPCFRGSARILYARVIGPMENCLDNLCEAGIVHVAKKFARLRMHRRSVLSACASFHLLRTADGNGGVRLFACSPHRTIMRDDPKCCSRIEVAGYSTDTTDKGFVGHAGD